jgi:hypothetical protein
MSFSWLAFSSRPVKACQMPKNMGAQATEKSGLVSTIAWWKTTVAVDFSQLPLSFC